MSLSPISVVAHRGDQMVAPENTGAAFSATGASSFDVVEFDVRFSADDVPVVIHDDTVDRTTNGSGAVASMTFAQLRALHVDIGLNASTLLPVIPTLWEALNRLAAYPATAILVELKVDPLTDARREKIISAIISTGVYARTTIMAFSAAILAATRAYAIASHSWAAPTGRYIDTLTETATQLAAETSSIIAPSHELITPELVTDLHALNRKVAAWTVQDPDEWVRLEAAGVDMILTEVPHDLRAWGRYR